MEMGHIDILRERFSLLLPCTLRVFIVLTVYKADYLHRAVLYRYVSHEEAE